MLNRDEVLSRIFNGIDRARIDYEKWSGWLVGHAPEYLLTTYIAKSIAGKEAGSEFWVTLENNVKETIDFAGSLKRGKPSKALRLQGKFDIVLWNKHKDKPRAIIEVKTRAWDYSSQGVRADIERICAILKQTRGISYGVLALYIRGFESSRKSGIEKVETKGNNIATRASEQAESMGLNFKRKCGEIIVKDGRAFASEILVISKRRGT